MNLTVTIPDSEAVAVAAAASAATGITEPVADTATAIVDAILTWAQATTARWQEQQVRIVKSEEADTAIAALVAPKIAPPKIVPPKEVVNVVK